MKNLSIPTVTEVIEEIEPTLAVLANALESVEALKIDDIESVKYGLQLLAALRDMHDTYNAREKELTADLKAAYEEIKSIFDKPCKQLGEAEGFVRQLILDFIESRYTKKYEILASLNGLPEHEKLSALERARSLDVPKIAGLQIRESQSATILNKDSLLLWALENERLDLIEINPKSATHLAKTLFSEIDISEIGLQLQPVRTIAIRLKDIE